MRDWEGGWGIAKWQSVTGSIAEVTNIENVIKGFQSHALYQAITRGFKISDILEIVRKGTPVKAMGRYGAQTRYTLGENVVVIDSKGEIITVFSNASGTTKGIGKGFLYHLNDYKMEKVIEYINHVLAHWNPLGVSENIALDE